MLNNNNNHNCTFAESIVSYLYNETGAKEKLAFEAHLKNCLMCADELAAFGYVRTSLAEWKEAEVFALEMPRLENPAIQTTAPVISTTSGSWLDNLRELLAWFPAWKTVSVAFAVLIVFVLAVFLVNSPDKTEVAANKDQNPSKESTESNKVQEQLYSETKTPPQKAVEENEKPKVSETAVIKDSAPKSNGAQKQKPIAPKTNETVAGNVVNRNEKKNKNIEKRELPRLSGTDEEEDKSLRLADLFDEIDTKL